MTAPAGSPDLILHRGRFTTPDRSNPVASAIRRAGGRDSDYRGVQLANAWWEKLVLIPRIASLSGRVED
jgi:hypothetical protein